MAASGTAMSLWKPLSTKKIATASPVLAGKSAGSEPLAVT